MKEIKSEKGITLTILIITIIILLILTGVSLYVYGDYSNSIRLQKFNTELDTIQIRVNEISNTNESYIDQETNEKIYLKTLGEDVPNDGRLDEILETMKEYNYPYIRKGFRFFTKENLEKQLDIHGVEQDVFINFNSKIVISANGLKTGDVMHYISTNQRYEPMAMAIEMPIIGWTITEESDELYVNIDTDSSIYSIQYRIKGEEEFWHNIIDNRFIAEKGKTYELQYTIIGGSTHQCEYLIST